MGTATLSVKGRVTRRKEEEEGERRKEKAYFEDEEAGCLEDQLESRKSPKDRLCSVSLITKIS